MQTFLRRLPESGRFPVEESEDTADSTDSTDGSTDTEEAYQPSEAEIAYAMSAAKEEADAALKTISTEENLLRTLREPQ